MLRSKHKPITLIERGLVCPGCDYSLEGAVGEHVTCPECGFACDRTRLIMQRWTQPWYRAPGYTMLCMPVAVLAIGGFATFVFSIFDMEYNRVPFRTVIVAVLTLVLWGLLLWLNRSMLPRGRATLLAMLGHAVLAAYIAGVICFFSGLVTMLAGWPMTLQIIIGSVVLLLSFALCIAGRRGEKFMARQCIRAYLAKQAQSGEAISNSQ